ncbi:hypothetical protein ABFS82_13G166000 [Erythranthe guttata]|uniref:uncharacterized protein LOC105969205 isoform X1 n=1 Tax=Erythranthe guttata TaxID=4155 RepID=UPI00064D910E|nr:PREDICTED: uncharacterized protein LOC105969205 isoform X1 [Erythranthe guttata]|eukprot:XP_012849409.1 PREDICTED: uncharacterized protein LOC105969205 isoform X1 [Erythranthe guttata]
MEKEPRKLVFRLTPWIFLLILPLIYIDLLWGNNIRIEQRFHYITGPETKFLSSSRRDITNAVAKQESLDYLLSRLVKDEDQKSFKATGFACNTEIYSKHCVANKPLRIDTTTMSIFVPDNRSVQEETVIRPYARQEDEVLLQRVTPVKILQGNITALPACEYTHESPAVVFSTSGFIGNVFHEINEILIPLFITTRQFKSRAVFVVEDYRPSFMKKYGDAISRLTKHEIVNPSLNRSVHCFPGAVVGLKFHGHLSLHPAEIPTGQSMKQFRQFLRESLSLKYSHVSQIGTPTVMFLSRRTTRRIINEDDVVSMIRDLGFRVIVVARSKVISNLNVFSSMINSCSVFVGAHGAGLTNELFLPDGAVMVQVDLIGLEWAAATYYGNPAREMGVRYLRYKIEPEESSLIKIFGSRNHSAITDPKKLPVQAGKEVYLNGQNVRINIDRFRETMVEAMSLVTGDSPL